MISRAAVDDVGTDFASAAEGAGSYDPARLVHLLSRCCWLLVACLHGYGAYAEVR
jgi:hypothetical protein